MKKFIVAAALAVLPSAAFAEVACYIGGSVGGGITSTQAPGITIAASGAIAGAEAGCDYTMGKVVLGGLARLDWSDIKTSVAGNTIKQDAQWTIGARAGYMLNTDVMPYAVVGYTGTTLSYAGLADVDRNGIMVGGGIEAKLVGNVWGFLEYNHVEYRKWTDGLTGDQLKPSSDVARIGARVKF